MKRNNTETDAHKIIQGRRLTEVMELKRMERTEIRKCLESSYYYPISRQTFDKYQKGINWMPQDFIEHIAEILGIDAGYIAGKDGYIFDEYSDYMFEKQCKEYKPYIKMLKQFGYDVFTVGMSWDNDPTDIQWFSVTRAGEDIEKKFTPEEFMQFFKECIDKGFDSFQQSLGSDPFAPEEIERLQQAQKKRIASKKSRKGSEKGSAPDDRQIKQKKGRK